MVLNGARYVAFGTGEGALQFLQAKILTAAATTTRFMSLSRQAWHPSDGEGFPMR
jgi:hypothetical protein